MNYRYIGQLLDYKYIGLLLYHRKKKYYIKDKINTKGTEKYVFGSVTAEKAKIAEELCP